MFTLCGHVELLGIGSQRQPWCHVDRAKASVGPAIPLHRSPYGIASKARLSLALRVLGQVGWDRNVLHTKLIAIIPGGRPPYGQQQHGSDGGGLPPKPA